MKLMIVEWVDPSGDSAEWISMREVLKQKPAVCRSVGWVVKETDNYIHLVPNIAHSDGATDDDEDDGCGGIVVPKVNIISTTEVV